LIYSPSRSRHYCNIEKAKWFASIVIIILFICNAHILFGYEKIHLDDKQFNQSYGCYIRKENILYNKLFHLYDSYIEPICFVIIPFIIMLICSLLIILQIFETRKTIRYNTQGKFYYYTFYTSETIRQTVRKTLQEQGTTRLRDKDIQLCCMLIGTTFAFLILCLPTEINDIFNYTGRDRSCSDWFRKVILMLMQQIYYAGHFYIYTLTGQLFRKHLYAMLFGSQDEELGNNQRHRSFPGRILANINIKYQRYKNESSNKDHNGRCKPSFTTTSFINTTPHRLQTTTVQSNDNCILNDPSQRLLSDSKYRINSY